MANGFCDYCKMSFVLVEPVDAKLVVSMCQPCVEEAAMRKDLQECKECKRKFVPDNPKSTYGLICEECL